MASCNFTYLKFMPALFLYISFYSSFDKCDLIGDSPWVRKALSLISLRNVGNGFHSTSFISVASFTFSTLFLLLTQRFFTFMICLVSRNCLDVEIEYFQETPT